MPRSKKRFCATPRLALVIRGSCNLEVSVAARSLLQSVGEQKQLVITPGVRVQPRQEQPPHATIFAGYPSVSKTCAHLDLPIFLGILRKRRELCKPDCLPTTTTRVWRRLTRPHEVYPFRAWLVGVLILCSRDSLRSLWRDRDRSSEAIEMDRSARLSRSRDDHRTSPRTSGYLSGGLYVITYGCCYELSASAGHG
jgi:hypothetical protein